MKTPRKLKPKLTDLERHKRFVEVAHKLEVPDDADLSSDFFKRLVNQRGKIASKSAR
jgi:hypothetical protein